MPRSGTSLTEQIISSHKLVKPAGEIGFWGMPTFDVIKNTPEESWLKMPEKLQAHSLARLKKSIKKEIDAIDRKSPAYTGLNCSDKKLFLSS